MSEKKMTEFDLKEFSMSLSLGAWIRAAMHHPGISLHQLTHLIKAADSYPDPASFPPAVADELISLGWLGGDYLPAWPPDYQQEVGYAAS